MENEELEQILSKYHLPSTPPGLDERIIRDVNRQLNAVRWKLYVGNFGMVIFDALGRFMDSWKMAFPRRYLAAAASLFLIAGAILIWFFVCQKPVLPQTSCQSLMIKCLEEPLYVTITEWKGPSHVVIRREKIKNKRLVMVKKNGREEYADISICDQ